MTASAATRQFVPLPVDLMSYARSGVKRDHVWIAMVIKSFMRDSRECWPSVKQIAETAGISTGTVRRLLAQMVSLGYLTIQKRQPKGGGQMTNLYRLAERFFHAAAKKAAPRRAPPPPPPSQKRQPAESTGDSHIEAREEIR